MSRSLPTWAASALASVFDGDIAEGLPPPHMARHDNGRFCGWDSALVQRAALMDALKKHGGR
jgi:hypothetical protein